MRTGGLRLIWSNPIVRAGPHACKVPKGQPVRWGTRSRGVRFACGCYGASNRSSFGLLVLCGVGWLASSRLSFGFHHVAFFESIKHEKEKLVLIADVLRWVFFFFFYVCCVWFVSPSVRASTTKTVISCVEAVRAPALAIRVRARSLVCDLKTKQGGGCWLLCFQPDPVRPSLESCTARLPPNRSMATPFSLQANHRQAEAPVWPK